MPTRPQPYHLQFPLNATQVEYLDEMLEILFQDLSNGNIQIDLSQILPGLDVGDLLYINSSGLIDGLTVGAVDTVLRSNGTLPVWGKVVLTTDVSGDLPYANLTPATAASLLLGRGSAAGGGDWQEITLGAGVTMTGTVLSSTGSGGDVVGPASSVNNEIVLFDGITGKLIKAAIGTGFVTSTSGVYGTQAAIDLTSDVIGTLPILNGGTGQTTATAAFNALSPLTTKGDLLAHDGTNNLRLAVGTNDFVLTADSTAPEGVSWKAGGGSGAPHDLLSLEHLDTFPGAPIAGDLIFARIIGEVPNPNVFGGGGYLEGEEVQALNAGRGALSSFIDGSSDGTFLNGFDPAIYTTALWDRLAVGADGEVLTISGGQPAWGTAGDVVGPGSATDNAIVRFDGTTGKLIQNSIATVSDSGEVGAVSALISGAIVAASGTITGGWSMGSAVVSGLLNSTGGQIEFPATQNPSADAHTLDDYEEGTWTPTIGGTTSESGQVYSLQNGYFVKIGRLVHVACRVQLSTLGTITGVVQIKGLPFASANLTGYRATVPVFWGNLTTPVVNIVGTLTENTTAFTLLQTAAATTSINTQFLVQADLSNTTLFAWSLVYEASA